MAIDQTGWTQEQKEEFERNWHTSNLTAIDFMEAHLLDEEGPIVQCVENSEAIGKYIVAHQLPWDIPSLEEALKNLSALGRIKRGTPISDELHSKKQIEDEARQKATAEAKAKEFPWGSELTVENDGPRRIKRMEGEYRLYMEDKKFGKEFVRQVEALRLTDLSLSGRI